MLNGSPSGTVQRATYDGHFASVSAGKVAKRIPRTALQKWQLTGSVLRIDSDLIFANGFEIPEPFSFSGRVGRR